MYSDYTTELQCKIDELVKRQEQQRLAQLRQQYTSPPNYANMSLREKLQTRFDLKELKQLQEKYLYRPQMQTPIQRQVPNSLKTGQLAPKQQYGDATSKKIKEYINDYQYPQGSVRTGIIAPIKDMIRNYNTMRYMKLKASDPFFHCKANYEAASRGIYGTIVANAIDIAKEIKDVFNYPISDSFRDYRANLRGQTGAWAGQTLQESCPTHYKDYEL